MRSRPRRTDPERPWGPHTDPDVGGVTRPVEARKLREPH